MDTKVEVTTISSFCQTVSAELGIDFQNIEFNVYNNGISRHFPICIEAGYKYHGMIVIKSSLQRIVGVNGVPHPIPPNILELHIDNADVLEGEANLSLNDKDNSVSYLSQKGMIEEQRSACYNYIHQYLYTSLNYSSKADYSQFSLKGKIKIVFGLTSQSRMAVIQNLQNSFTSSKMKSLEEAQDSRIFTLKVENRPFEFNKNSLLAVSSVFADMFAACSEEKNSLPIEDGTSIQTMNTFKKLMQNQEIKKDELTADLYIFGDKYDIQPFVFNRENFFEITHAAYKMKNDALLELCAKFLKNNETILKTDPKMKQLTTHYEGLCAKLFGLMMN